MIRATARKTTTAARVWPAAAVLAGLIALSACATPSGAGQETPAASGTPVTPEPTPTASMTEEAPTAAPTASPDSDLPYNGQVLIVTAERDGGQLQVTAMIPGVAEDGGTCTLRVEGEQASATVTGIAGNGVTYCGVMSVAADSAGESRFRVSYTSTSTRAQSALSTVEPNQ